MEDRVIVLLISNGDFVAGVAIGLSLASDLPLLFPIDPSMSNSASIVFHPIVKITTLGERLVFQRNKALTFLCFFYDIVAGFYMHHFKNWHIGLSSLLKISSQFYG